jgi:uncharacterized protein YjiS (DUF1127 family)
MQASCSTARRIQSPAGHALVIVLVELAAAGYHATARALAGIAAAQERTRARRELERLSDHSLKDIGLSRSDIERLYR